MPHLTNSVTKNACGIVKDKATSKNKDMDVLLTKIVKTVYEVKFVDKMGTAFADLCDHFTESKSRTLITFKDHRFMGLVKVVERIIEKWDALAKYYRQRELDAIRDNTAVPTFWLEHDKLQLIQLVSLLQPVLALNKKSQAESANQLDVLLTLYKLRVKTLDYTTALPSYVSNHLFAPVDLLPAVAIARKLMSEMFHKNYFCRYTTRKKIKASSFVYEMQLMLHPILKNNLDENLRKMVRICSNERPGATPANTDRNVEEVEAAVMKNIRKIMCSLQITPGTTNNTTRDIDNPPAAVISPFSEDIMELFGATQEAVQEVVPQQDLAEMRVDEEISRWLRDGSQLEVHNGALETVLEFWKRQSESNAYVYLPLVARIIFAIPASSCQIERDFGVSGMMVTSQRAALSGHNIDMCSFLNRNQHFVDICQCDKIDDEYVEENIPKSSTKQLFAEGMDVLASLGFSNDGDDMIAQLFSTSSIQDDDE